MAWGPPPPTMRPPKPERSLKITTFTVRATREFGESLRQIMRVTRCRIVSYDGAAGRTRTPDQEFRKLQLFPPELQPQALTSIPQGEAGPACAGRRAGADWTDRGLGIVRPRPLEEAPEPGPIAEKRDN